MDVYIPQARAALAFRTALSVVICGSLSMYLSSITSPTTFSYAEAALSPIFAFMMPAMLRGDTCKLSLTWITSAFLLTPLGIGMSFLCYLAGGYQWRTWILSIGLAAVVFLVVVWGTVATVLHAPKVLLAGSPAALLYAALCPILAIVGAVDHQSLLTDTACMTATLLSGALMSLLLSHLPYGIGAAPAWHQAPALGAEKLAALAETFEAVAIWQRRDSGSFLRHRECRLRVLKASHCFRTTCASAAFELWDLKTTSTGPAKAASPLEAFSTESETCRLALQLKSRMLTLGLSPISMELLYGGPTGQALRDCCFVGAKALRYASSLLAELGGKTPPSEIPAATWLHSPHPTAHDCQEAAAECRDVLARYKQVWSSMYLDEDAPHSWKVRIEAAISERMEGKSSVEYFLDGSYHMRALSEAQHREEALRLAFDEASRNAASFIGICAAAESAAKLAELVSTASPSGPSCGCATPRVTGIQHWLRAPFAGRKAWLQGWAKGKSYALRISTALLMTSLVIEFIPPNNFWPGKNKGLWTLVTVALITTPVQGATLLRGLRRGAGTVVGSALAVGSVALMGAAPSFRMLWSQIFLMAFGLKFFEQEFQYAGAVTFVTYMVVLSSLSDLLAANAAPPLDRAVEIASRRCVDVMMGIVVATVLSIFLAPDRAIDELRTREEEALKCGVSALRRSAAMLAFRAAGNIRDPAEDHEAWEELRNEAWSSFEALNFAGDGQPGVGDLLEDARWEGRWGVDGGVLLLGGLLWLPERFCRCCGHRKKPSSRRCLEAVLSISRLLRVVNMLVGMLQRGLGEDADLPLSNDPRVLQALGPDGDGLITALDAALASATALLRGEKGEKAEPAIAELESRLQLLLLGAGASRQKAGGLARNRNLGGLRAAAAIKLLEISIRALGETLRCLEGNKDKLDRTRSVRSTSSPARNDSQRTSSPSSDSSEPSEEDSSAEVDVEEGCLRL